MTKHTVYLDFSNFSKHGGVEKNGKIIAQLMSNNANYNLKIIESKLELIKCLACCAFSKKSVFVSFKGSAFAVELFRFAGSRIVVRINNSPEAYLFWRKLSSVFSFYLRLRSVKRDYSFFNSKKVKEFYQSVSNCKINSFYLPNVPVYAERFNFAEGIKVFAASRLSVEKNYLKTYNAMQVIAGHFDCSAYYFSTSTHLKTAFDVLSYKNLTIHFNDVYVSLSHFEGMPNMALEALYSGAILVLSNNWAHTELMNMLEEYDLGGRVALISDGIIGESTILKLRAEMATANAFIVAQKVDRLKKVQDLEFQMRFKKFLEVCSE